ncbi:MAG: ribbon-helix-helix protein, CopG family, partial [Crenarchaeota archaeon]|nr:ribbon-helix-helix protein, CopG family [Thermoproteota archaeon]
MKLISVHLPEWMIRELEKLVQKGYFPSRSEAI